MSLLNTNHDREAELHSVSTISSRLDWFWNKFSRQSPYTSQVQEFDNEILRVRTPHKNIIIRAVHYSSKIGCIPMTIHGLWLIVYIRSMRASVPWWGVHVWHETYIGDIWLLQCWVRSPEWVIQGFCPCCKFRLTLPWRFSSIQWQVQYKRVSPKPDSRQDWW